MKRRLIERAVIAIYLIYLLACKTVKEFVYWVVVSKIFKYKITVDKLLCLTL